MMLAGQRTGQTAFTNTNEQNAKIKAKLKTSGGEIERIQVPDSLRNASTLRVAQYISKEIYKNEMLKGFYRGYFLSTFLVSLNSALWWPFYYWYIYRRLLF